MDPAIQVAIEQRNQEQARDPGKLFGDGREALEELHRASARRWFTCSPRCFGRSGSRRT